MCKLTCRSDKLFAFNFFGSLTNTIASHSAMAAMSSGRVPVDGFAINIKVNPSPVTSMPHKYTPERVPSTW